MSLRDHLSKSGLDQSELAGACLILIAAIHHVGNSLPPHVCFDLFLSSEVTVKDEGPPCRAGNPARSCADPPRPQLGAPPRRWESVSSARRGVVVVGGEGRAGLLANCRPKSVTLGDGGIKAC